jgi:transcriptional regulator with XRE-family HTH domain
MGSFMHLHKKVSLFRTWLGITQEQMAEKLNMSPSGYAKIERGETRLQTDRLEKIVAVLGVELKDFVGFDEKMVFNASFHNIESCQHQNYYINSAKELTHELEKLQLTIQQKDKEIYLLQQQINDLREMVQLLKIQLGGSAT